MWQRKVIDFASKVVLRTKREKILLYICDLFLSRRIIINDNEFYIIAAKDMKNLLKDTTWELLLHVDTCLLHEATISAPSSTSSHARILPCRCVAPPKSYYFLYRRHGKADSTSVIPKPHSMRLFSHDFGILWL